MRSLGKFLVVALACAAGANAASAVDFETLYTFAGGADGAYPDYGLINDGTGKLYGTTRGTDGAKRYGTVFRVIPPTGPTTIWTKENLYSFAGGADGAYPSSKLIGDGIGGAFLGTTVGGDTPDDFGTVYRLSNNKHGWVERIVHHFTGGTDSGYPRGQLIQDAGTYEIYGTTFGNTADGDFGSLYSWIPFNGEHTKWIRGNQHDFTGPGTGEGAYPQSSLRLGPDGYYYGNTTGGGNPLAGCIFMGVSGCGTIFRMNIGTSAVTFPVASTGPPAPSLYGTGDMLMQGNHVLYGGSTAGSTLRCQKTPSCGTLFTMDLDHGMTPVVLHAFKGKDGGGPVGSLIYGVDSFHIYGTTQYGGTGPCMESGKTVGCGVVFELLNINNDRYKYIVLYDFQGAADGYKPHDLILGYDNTLYGETENGGTGGFGTIFHITNF